MKSFKKVLALLVAMVMVLGTMNSMGTVFGAEQPDSTIEITGLAKDDVVHFYQVIEWVGDATGNVAGWKAVAPFDTVLTEAELIKAIDTDNENYTGITSELAGKLARVANKVEATGLGSPVTVTSNSASLTIGDNLGMYMALITPADVDTVYNPVFVSADYKAGDNTHNVTDESSYYNKSAAKKTTNDLEKTAENADDYNGDNGDTAAVGDTISFTVTTNIPGYGKVFESPEFVITDSLDALELKANTITITVDGTEVDDNNTNDYYTLSATNSGYTVTFKPTYLKTLSTPVDVKIEYDATVLESATVANINQEKNTVTVKYSNNPADESSKKYKKDTTNHYTFSLDADNLFKTNGFIGESGSEFIKISVDRNGEPIYSDVNVWSNVTPTNGQQSPLKGAQFELKDKDGKSFDPQKVVESDANGRIKFENLDAGTYILEEISAPTGFVRDTSQHTIVITADITQNVPVTEYFDANGTWYTESGEGRTPYTYETDILNSYSVTFDGANVATHTFTHTSTDQTIKWSSSESTEIPTSIHNTKGVELPSTGGIGTTLFYAIGAILVICSGILLVTRRRVKAN